jgi:hypothetical protein
MEVLMKLFKYCGASLQDIANLSAAKIWFSDPAGFNDPFDCAYDIVVPPLTREECHTFLNSESSEELNNALAVAPHVALEEKLRLGFAAAIERTIGKAGVSCFSTVHDSLLMWGHYAQSHRGYCLEFSTANEPLFSTVHPVQYANALPRLSSDALLKAESVEILNLLLTKAKCWEYEHEWRVLHSARQTLYSYQRASLTGIYFGARMPEDQRLMIAALLGKGTKLYEMSISKTCFELETKPLPPFQRINYDQPQDSAPGERP